VTFVIPMAGESRRFRDAGYVLPKYMLYCYDRSLFNLSVSSFSRYFNDSNFVFIIRDIFDTRRFVSEECIHLGIKNYTIVTLGMLTRGQAETVKLGIVESRISSNEPIIIFNIDTIRTGFVLPDLINEWDGYLEVFKGGGPNWSYAKVIPNTTRVIETAEKKEISDNCSTGLYYFKSCRCFCDAFEYFDADKLYGKEFYVAPLYNYLINALKMNIHINIISSAEVLFCGIPEEYTDMIGKWKHNEYGA